MVRILSQLLLADATLVSLTSNHIQQRNNNKGTDDTDLVFSVTRGIVRNKRYRG